MASNLTRVFSAVLVAAGLQLLAAPGALGRQDPKAEASTPAAAHAQAAKARFGGAETLKGLISLVKPDAHLVVITRTGPGNPSSTRVSWSQTVARGTQEVIDKSPMTVSEQPGATDYAFRITNATAIKVKGRKASLAELAASLNQEATVRFTARRQGDFAMSIEVGP